MRTHKLKLSFTVVSLMVLLGVSVVAFIANAQAPNQPGARAQNAPGEAAAAQEEAGANSAAQRNQNNQATDTPRGAAAPHATATKQRSENAANGAERAQERRAALAERAQERVTNLAANMSNKMEAAVWRFTQILERLRSRMEKLQNRGVDVSVAMTHVQDTEAALTEASATLAGIDELIAEMVSSETPQQAWHDARTTYKDVREQLRNAHYSLRGAVAALKSAVRAAEQNGVSDAVRNENSFRGSTSTDNGTSTETDTNE